MHGGHLLKPSGATQLSGIAPVTHTCRIRQTSSLTAEEPGLPELTALQGRGECINIAERIGPRWRLVGLALLQDRTGDIVSAIDEQYRGNALAINIEILSRWVRGRGIADRTWRGLLGVLNLHCKALAESVEEALTVKEATDTEQGKLSQTKHKTTWTQ